MINMNKELIYALAPDGSTHTIGDKYRRYDAESGTWFGWDDDYEEWDFIKHPSPHGYTPIPARELELNRLAGEWSEWPCDKSALAGIENGKYFSFSWAEWQARRALRLEHGLILEPAPEINETPESQWMPEVGEICEAYNFSLDIWVKAKTLDAKTESTPETAFVAINPDGTCRMLFWSHNFRPIKTERERFVSIALRKVEEAKVTSDASFARAIHDWLTESGVDLSPLLEDKDHE
jgi:hypothetical protein